MPLHDDTDRPGHTDRPGRTDRMGSDGGDQVVSRIVAAEGRTIRTDAAIVDSSGRTPAVAHAVWVVVANPSVDTDIISVST